MDAEREGQTKLLVIFHIKKISPFEKTHFAVKNRSVVWFAAQNVVTHTMLIFLKMPKCSPAQNKYPTVHNHRKNSPAVPGEHFSVPNQNTPMRAVLCARVSAKQGVLAGDNCCHSLYSGTDQTAEWF